jgi:hypothetical protein
MTDARFHQIVQTLGLTDEFAASFGLTPEQAEAHRQALREALEIGASAFLQAVARDTAAADQGAPLTGAARLRLEARRALAQATEEYYASDLLAQHNGPAH